ncbi:permease [Patescibacteria group bacterium]|nr:permease [Patescibacteria group bacterium]
MLTQLADFLTFTILKIEPETTQAAVVHFFLYDSIKILLLLIVITHFMSLLRYYLPIEKMRAFLTSHKFYGADYFLATIFGAVTPFCSCSSIPLFIGFVEAGIPLGVTLSFLITSPLINEVAVALFISMFGWKVTLLYVGAGIAVGMIGGMILSRMRLEQYIEEFVQKSPCKCKQKSEKSSVVSICLMLSKDAMGIVKQVAPFVLIGVMVGALIHGYVPEGFFEQYIQKDNLFAVPAAVILAVPLYANASGVIPIIESLVDKGIPLGTALAFMMAVVGLSLPEALILKKVMKLKLLLAFFGVVTLGIMLIGYGFNIML